MQARIDELCMHHGRNPTTVTQILTQSRDLQNKVDYSDAREFLRSWDSWQLGSDPRSHSNLHYSASQDHALLRFWIAARYTEYCGYFRKRFCSTICSRRTNLRLSSTIQRIWHLSLWNWDLILKEMQRGRRMEWDDNREIHQDLYHASKEKLECMVVLVELILTMVWLMIQDSRFRNCILANTLWNFKDTKSISRLKYVQRQQIFIFQCTGSKKLT